MNHAEALATLADLQEQAKAAVAAGDVAAGEQVLLTAIWMKLEPETPSSRALGRAFSALPVELATLVRPEAVIGGLNRAGHAFQHAPDAQFGDFIAVLYHMVLAHERARDSAKLGEAITQIVQLAGTYVGEVDGQSALVLMHFADWCRTTWQYLPMQTLQAQVLRYMLADEHLSDDTRAAWLSRHADAMREAGQADTLRADLDRAEAIFAARDDAPLSLGLCQFERSRRLAAEGDWRGSALLVDSALAAAGLPSHEQTTLLSLAARAWFKAGDFERSAERSKRALRRRVGLAAS